MLFWLFITVVKTDKVVRCCPSCRQLKTTSILNWSLIGGNKDNGDNQDNFFAQLIVEKVIKNN